MLVSDMIKHDVCFRKPTGWDAHMGQMALDGASQTRPNCRLVGLDKYSKFLGRWTSGLQLLRSGRQAEHIPDLCLPAYRSLARSLFLLLCVPFF